MAALTKPPHIFAGLLVLGGLLSACAARETVPNPASLSVQFDWQGTERCSTVSPRLTIGGAPASVARFAVAMNDLDFPSFNHGGGEVARPASDVIPLGALGSYRGPCPPAGATNRYRFQVQGIDAQNRIAAQGEAMRTFPP